MNPLTEEQQVDVTERTKTFMERYGELVKEMDIDFACYPAYMPTEKGTFEVIVQQHPVDMKYRPVKSTFV